MSSAACRDAQAGEGSLVWVCRGRLPAAAGDGNWFLQDGFGQRRMAGSPESGS